MSSDDMVVVRGLRKSYPIVRAGDAPTTFREAIGARLRGRPASTRRELFVALDDVSFDVAEGEILGIVGINGAGKSTLLKILSGVTFPDEGRVELFGRTGSLLEVGTGFHPELTGRENIFLNGAILGMSRSFITRQFDAIVDFAEIEQFLDTPVKRYSSGMYVRLAFSIAAHLEPEILIVDEALSVGDVGFQRKCLEKIHQVSVEHGRTVLFVSHNMHAIETLCERVLVLEHGRLLLDGAVRDGVHTYLQVGEDEAAQRGSGDGTWDLTGRPPATGSPSTYIQGLVTRADGDPAPVVQMFRSLSIVTRLSHLEEVPDPVLALRVSAETGQQLFTSLQSLGAVGVDPAASVAEVELAIPDLPFAPGSYVIDVALLRDDGATFVDGVAAAAFLSVEHPTLSAEEWERANGDGRVVVPSAWRIAERSDPSEPDLD